MTDEYDMRWTHGSSGTGMGLLLASAGAVTTAFDQRFVRVHARGAWLVAVAEPLQRPNAHGSTGGEVGRKIFPPFGDCRARHGAARYIPG